MLLSVFSLYRAAGDVYIFPKLIWSICRFLRINRFVNNTYKEVGVSLCIVD